VGPDTKTDARSKLVIRCDREDLENVKTIATLRGLKVQDYVLSLVRRESNAVAPAIQALRTSLSQ
jgi:predicted DNA binding CopG/RHH family protein